MKHDANDDAISVQVDIPTPTEPETPPEHDTTVIVIGTDTTDDAIPDPVIADILTRVGALEEGRVVDAARLRELEEIMARVANEPDTEPDTEPEFIETEPEPEPAEPDEPPEETHWLHRPMREWLGRR